MISQTDRVNFQGSFILRDLRGSGDPQSAVSDTGWGINLSGVIDMPDRLAPDFASYSLSYGYGYGGFWMMSPSMQPMTLSTIAWRRSQPWAGIWLTNIGGAPACIPWQVMGLCNRTTWTFSRAPHFEKLNTAVLT